MSCTHDKSIVSAQEAPRAIGPYSHGVKFGPFFFSSGQVGLDPTTGNLVPGGIEAETRQVFANLKSVLAAAELQFSHVLKTTVFLKDMADFTKMNAIYAEYFTEDFPARSTVQVAALPKSASIEIEVVAGLPHQE